MDNIKDIIDELDRLLVELNSYRPIPEDRMNRIMQKLRLEWNFNSNSMEGNTLTKSETRKLILYGITAKGKPLRDHIEIEGHDKALKKLESLVHKDLKITETLIKDFHKMIMAESKSLEETGVEINPGEWKKHHNYLYSPTGERIDFAAPKDVPNLMSDLINWANNHLYQGDLNWVSKKKYKTHPLIVACVFHKRFINIHPFGDGNGRMGRIMMNLILMQNGFMPAIVPLTSKDPYYLALNDSTAEDMSPLIEYIGKNLIDSMKLAIEGAKGNSVEEPEDWEKEMEVLKLKLENKIELQAKTELILRNLYVSGLYGFLLLFIERMKIFDDFFHQKHDNLAIIEKIDAAIKQLDKLIKEGEEISGKFFEDFTLNFRWNVFKYKDYEEFTMTTQLRLEFTPTYYIIHYLAPNHQQLKKYYPEPPTKQEQSEIITLVGKVLKQKIEHHTQK